MSSQTPEKTRPPEESPDHSIQTRQTLLERLKDVGDDQAWKTFFDRYQGLIYRFARKGGLNHAEANDVVQDTVISVARNIDGFRYDPEVCRFKTWMLRVTRWRIIGQLKRRKALERSLDASYDGAPEVTGPDLETVWEEEWRRHVYETAFEEVRRHVRPLHLQMWDLCVNQDWAPREVAKMLGGSTARVYVIKHRVGRAIQRQIQRLEDCGTG